MPLTKVVISMKFKTAQIHEWCSCWRTSKLLNYPNSVKDPCHIIWTSADVTPISVGFLFFSSLTDHCLLPLFGTPFLTVHRKLFHVEEWWTLRLEWIIQKTCIIHCCASKWFLLFYSCKLRSQLKSINMLKFPSFSKFSVSSILIWEL